MFTQIYIACTGNFFQPERGLRLLSPYLFTSRAEVPLGGGGGGGWARQSETTKISSTSKKGPGRGYSSESPVGECAVLILFQTKAM